MAEEGQAQGAFLMSEVIANLSAEHTSHLTQLETGLPWLLFVLDVFRRQEPFLYLL